MTTRRAANLAILSVAALAMAPRIASAQTQLTIVLPPPRADFGKSLGEVLRLRRSTRSFDPRPLPPQPGDAACQRASRWSGSVQASSHAFRLTNRPCAATVARAVLVHSSRGRGAPR